MVNGEIMTRKIILLGAVVALASVVGGVGVVGVVCAQDTRPAGDPVLAQQFLAAGREAFASGNSSAAGGALRRAVRHDPKLAEAHCLLARIALGRKDRPAAIEHFQAVVKLVNATADGEPAKWRTEAKRQLERLCVYLRQWDRVRREFAQRYRKLGLAHRGKPSGVAAFEAAAIIAPEVADIPGALAKLRQGLANPLPAPAKEADPDGAKLLIRRAAGLQRKGKRADAAELLCSAYALAPDGRTLLTLADLYLCCAKPAEAAVVLVQAERMLTNGDAKPDRASSARLSLLFRRADPGRAALAAMHKRFAARGESLARRAIASKDCHAAGVMLTVVLKLQPDRKSAVKLMSFRSGSSPAVGRLPNLKGKWIEFKAFPAHARVVRTRRSVELKAVTRRKKGGGLCVMMDFTRMSWGRNLRATWRVERLDRRTKVEGDYQIAVGFWPLGGTGQVYVFGRRWSTIHDGPEHRMTKGLTGVERKELFREDGKYEITFEKVGKQFSIMLDGHLAWQIEFSDKALKAASGRMLYFMAKCSSPERGHRLHMKVTLLEFSCSGDCIHRKPLKPLK